MKEEDAPKVLTPIKAIRAKCLDCCCGAFSEVRSCPCQSCPLFPYRLGHRPKRERKEEAEDVRFWAPDADEEDTVLESRGERDETT